MPRKGGASKNKKEKTRGSNELNLWLLKRVADRALPLAARSAIHVRPPSLLSYIRRQRHLGEGNGRLARWVTEHASLASTALQTVRSPLASWVSDFVRRKTAFVPPGWQRKLSLSWFRQPRKQEHGSVPTLYAAPDWPRTNDTSPGSNDLGPAKLLPTAPVDKARQLLHATDKARPRATPESHPLMTTPLFSPPVMSGEQPGTAVATMPVKTDQIADRLDLGGLTKIAPVTEEEHQVSMVNESYPAVIENFLSPPLLGKRLPDTTSEHSHHARPGSILLMTKQIAVGQLTKDADNFTLSRVGQSRIPNPSIDQSSEFPERDRRRVEVAPERRPRPLSRLLTPMTQSVAPQPRLMETHPGIISSSHPPQTGQVDYPKAIVTEGESSSVTAGQAPKPFTSAERGGQVTAPTSPTLRRGIRPVTLERKTLPDALPGPSEPPITNAVSKRRGGPAIPRTFSKPDGLASDLPPYPAVFPGESRRVLPDSIGVATSPPLEAGQAQMREPAINRSAGPAGQKAGVTGTPGDLTDLTMSQDTPGLVTRVRGGMERGFPAGYKEPLSVARLAISLPVIESISRTMAFPTQQLYKSAARLTLSDRSEDHGLLESREYVFASPSYKYARQPALELPVAFPARPKADLARSEELFRHMSDTKPEPAHSGNYPRPEVPLAAAPVGQVLRAEEPPKPAAPAPRGEKGVEKETAPDLRALAREVYPLIKRMVMVERERRPT